MKNMKTMLGTTLLAATIGMGTTGCGVTNPETPAGHEGYVISQPYFIGTGGYIGTMRGPQKFGMSWRKFVTNIDTRPKTYNEEFHLMAKDQLTIDFKVHAKMKVRDGAVRSVVENFGEDWYKQSVMEPLRTYVQDAAKDYTSLEAKDSRDVIRSKIMTRMGELTKGTPFETIDIVVGNITFPAEVTKAVEQKLAAKQKLEEMATQEEIATRQAKVAVEEAKGIAESQRIINATLTPQYLQHEAIKSAEKLAGSPNTTFYFVPTSDKGMGVPMVYGMSSDGTPKQPAAPAQPRK